MNEFAELFAKSKALIDNARNRPIADWTIDSGSSEFSFQIELDTLSGFDDD